MDDAKTKRYTFVAEIDLLNRLRVASAKDRRTIANAINLAISEWLDKQKEARNEQEL